MADMSRIIGAVITISVSVIILASVLAPTITEYTASGASLAEYSSLLGAVVVIVVVGILMVGVRLISSKF